MTRRRFFLLIHRANGLFLAAFLVVAGTTGAALAWRIQIERLFAPKLFVLPAHSRTALRADPMAVRQQVEIAYPWAHVDVADLSSAADVPLEFALTSKRLDDTTRHDDQAFADPYSGRVLGSRRYGDLRQGLQNFLPAVYELHQELALGRFGTSCLGVVATLWTVDCFIGMYLSLPASRRRLGWSRRKRIGQWPGRFWPSLKVRWRPSPYRRLHDLHRASGVWLWLMLLVFAWTGVAFNLPVVYGRVMHIFGGSLYTEDRLAACPHRQSAAAEPDWASTLALARTRMRSEATRRGFTIDAERFLSYDRGTYRWTYRVHSTLDIDRIGNTQLIWQDGDAENSIFSAPTGQRAADTFSTLIEAMHEAQIGGPAFRMLVCATGLGTAFLSVTGVFIFLRKTQRSEERTARRGP